MGARISAGSQQESGQGVPASTNTRTKPRHSRSHSGNTPSGPDQSQPSAAPPQSRGTAGQEGDKNAAAAGEDNFNENGSPSGAGNRGELTLTRRSGSAGRGPSRSGPLTRRMNEARGERSSSSGSSGSRTRSGAPKNPIHSAGESPGTLILANIWFVGEVIG